MTLSQLIGEDTREAQKTYDSKHPVYKILKDAKSPEGLKELANDRELVAALRVTEDEWKSLGSIKLPCEVSKRDQAAARMADFFRRCRQQEDYWKRISDAGLQRVAERYTWDRYAEKMMTLSRIYGFWKYVSDLERAETQRYLEMFYGLQFRPLAQQLDR